MMQLQKYPKFNTILTTFTFIVLVLKCETACTSSSFNAKQIHIVKRFQESNKTNRFNPVGLMKLRFMIMKINIFM